MHQYTYILNFWLPVDKDIDTQTNCCFFYRLPTWYFLAIDHLILYKYCDNVLECKFTYKGSRIVSFKIFSQYHR